MINCTFIGNTAEHSGGGMSNQHNQPTVGNCTFVGNSSARGGGMSNEGSNPTVANCRFSGNTAHEDGAGMFNRSSDPTVTNCIFSTNTAQGGGGMFNMDTFRSEGSRPTVTNCTFMGNIASAGGGIVLNDNEGLFTVTNCILWQNTDNGESMESAQIHVVSSRTAVTFSLIQGLDRYSDGTGNIDGDPLFVDAENGDLHLRAGSPAIDAGSSFFGLPVDFDRHPRAVDDPATPDTGIGPVTFVDMGAFEFQGAGELMTRLDIKPGSCPNLVNPKSQGVIPIAIVGSESFDVTEIDIDSLELTRADGVGGSVIPLRGPPGPKISVEDVATPLNGDACDCHDLQGDGIDDLVLKFSTTEVVSVLELDGIPPGTSVTLMVSGSLLDGTAFSATDCVLTTPGPLRVFNTEAAVHQQEIQALRKPGRTRD